MSRFLCWLGLHATIYVVHEDHYESICHVCGKKGKGRLERPR